MLIYMLLYSIYLCFLRTAYATMLRKHLRKAHNSNRLTNTTENLTTESAEPLKGVTMSPCTPLMSVPYSTSPACQSSPPRPSPPPRPSSPPRAMSPRRSYNPVDYSKDVKLFACQMCTMKFVKLINLYKHLHIQHAGSDITRVSKLIGLGQDTSLFMTPWVLTAMYPGQGPWEVVHSQV